MTTALRTQFRAQANATAMMLRAAARICAKHAECLIDLDIGLRCKYCPHFLGGDCNLRHTLRRES